ncbi:MAG: 4a-hydroxytetrahydrobiopterin dehydratase [Crocinitomicaceae bacterium]
MEIENWRNTGKELVRDFVFENQTELAEFVLMVAKYSDKVGHHADMYISEYRKLRVSISTHDENKLTEKDVGWAKAINEKV